MTIFGFKDIATFKVKVMSADPKPENGASDVENKIEPVGEVSEKNVGEVLTERQKKILKYVEKDNMISAKDISKLLQVTNRTIERDIQKLMKMKILERVGSGRSGYWKIK